MGVGIFYDQKYNKPSQNALNFIKKYIFPNFP